ncbi:MAG: hypothetical protein LBL33_03285 [Tannerella sp.]|nr:hypothetical protein [Tannerella sp.]
MKAVNLLKLSSLLFSTAMFFGCGPNDKSILKKYETHSPVELSANRSGISLEVTGDSTGGIVLNIPYSHPALNMHRSNVDLLSGRLYIVNAENTDERLDVESVTVERIGSDSTKSEYLSRMSITKEISVKYALVCFEGIDKGEFAGAETPPCFFIVSLDGKMPHVLTEIPLSAGATIVAEHPEGKFIRFTEPQIYSGEIPFKGSKDVGLTITVSADATQAVSWNLHTGESGKLVMYPVKAGSYITSTSITGSFESVEPVDILDNKIAFSYFDLTVTDACIYGTVKVEMDDCATERVYAVLSNTTTPQDIPGDILNPEKR